MNTWCRPMRVLPLVAAVVTIFGMMALDLAYAQPGRGMGRTSLTQEQAQKIYELRQKFLKETEDLRQQMFTKRNELNNLWAQPNPDETQIRAKQQEINAIRDKIQAIAVTYQAQARKIAPNAYFGWGKGMGQGMGKGMGGGPWSVW